MTVTIAYKSTDGDEYVDELELDTDLIRGRTYATSSGPPETKLKEAAKSLSSIERSLAEIAKNSSPPAE